jgi:threonine aldolase
MQPRGSQSYPTLQDVQAHVVLSEDVHVAPTRLLSLENTLDGQLFPLPEMQAITSYAQAHDIRVHLDGARLLHAVVASSTPLAAYAACVDSLMVCMSKALGAPVGSVLLGRGGVG